MIQNLRGTGVALVTPFDKSGNVDFNSLKNVINHVIKGGVNYVVSLGTTGETPVLTSLEKDAIVRFTVEVVKKRVPIVVGIGANSTQDVINSFKTCNLEGVDAILSVSPYYNKPSQQGIIAHYKAIAKHTKLPIILYNVPGRTNSNMTAETTLQLAREVKNIVAVKEASGNMDQIMQIIKHKPKDFLVISGDDLITLPILASGGDGVISVIANAFPKEFSLMTKYSLEGNFEKARKQHYLLDGFTRLIFADGNPAGVKCVLNLMKVCQPFVRLPLVQVNSRVEADIKKAYSKY